MTEQRPPLPPFTRDSAIQKVRAAEDGWNSRDAEKVALAYTVDSEWRNRSEFVHGRREIVDIKNSFATGSDEIIIKLTGNHPHSHAHINFNMWINGVRISSLIRTDHHIYPHRTGIIPTINSFYNFLQIPTNAHKGF